jgi:predicted Zn-ribbon and HTH transcriptional regulator
MNAGLIYSRTLSSLRKSIAEAASRSDDAIVPIVGRCPCGGRFGLYPPVRCPFCKSTQIKNGRLLVDYI